MGNKESKLDVAGEMYIELNHVTINAGQPIEGTLHLNMKKPMSSHHISINLGGTEITKYTYWVHTGNSSYRVKCRGELPIISNDSIIYEFKEGFAKPG